MALTDLQMARLLGRDNTVPYRFDDPTVNGLIEVFGTGYQAAVAMVRLDIAKLSQEGTVSSKSIADQSYSRQYSLSDLQAYAAWLEEQAKKLDPLNGSSEVTAGVMWTEVASLFGLGMHDGDVELSSYVWETL